MPETISARFDPTDLPAWAQRNPTVVARCRANYEYRCDVCRAETTQQARHLTELAERIAGDLANR